MLKCCFVNTDLRQNAIRLDNIAEPCIRLTSFSLPSTLSVLKTVRFHIYIEIVQTWPLFQINFYFRSKLRWLSTNPRLWKIWYNLTLNLDWIFGFFFRSLNHVSWFGRSIHSCRQTIHVFHHHLFFHTNFVIFGCNFTDYHVNSDWYPVECGSFGGFIDATNSVKMINFSALSRNFMQIMD